MTPTPDLLRSELTSLPERLKSLPVHRGYPVPWFVGWVDGEPEFRAMDARKWVLAVKERLCWICGQKLGGYLAFVLGPMCGITRTTVEPAMHYSCAQWSVMNCPFLTKPQMVRRTSGLPEDVQDPAGCPLDRNPGVSIIWITRGFSVFYDHENKPLLRVGDPLEISCWREGRPATLEELQESVAGGLPKLGELAVSEGAQAMKELEEQVQEFWKLIARHG